MSQRFERAASVLLDASGNGQIEIRAPAGKEWRVQRTTVVCNNPNPTLVPTARIYRNSISDSTFIDGTYSGAMDISDTEYEIPAGDAIIICWEDGEVGLTATARIVGRQYSIGELDRG
jgi:hypothetical protein